jgi:hypothetical protein
MIIDYGQFASDAERNDVGMRIFCKCKMNFCAAVVLEFIDPGVFISNLVSNFHTIFS